MNNTLSERLNRHSEEGPNGCRLWKSYRNKWGYGVLMWERSTHKAHRLAWTAANGPIPPGMLVCHRCDMPACINPAHLFLGTNADNVADMFAKGRARKARGEQGGNTKLTEAQVRVIRAMPGRHRDIAAKFGVTHPLIGAIKRGKIWKHVA